MQKILIIHLKMQKKIIIIIMNHFNINLCVLTLYRCQFLSCFNFFSDWNVKKFDYNLM